MTYSYNRLWKLLIDKRMTKTEMRGLNRGAFYERFHANAYNPNDVHDKLKALYKQHIYTPPQTHCEPFAQAIQRAGANGFSGD